MQNIQTFLVRSLQPTVTLFVVLVVSLLLNACSTVSDRQIMVFTPKKAASQEVVAMDSQSAEQKNMAQNRNLNRAK